MEIALDELRKMLKDIKLYKGDDPLLPWLRCITWIKTSPYAKQLTSFHQDVLELCIESFCEDKRYASDTRYVQVWIQYADCCHGEAEKVFKRMEALHIGQDAAVYYGAYAIYLEVGEDYVNSNRIYQSGLTRQAKPAGMLEEAYNGFLKRVARHHLKTLMKDKKPTVFTPRSPLCDLGENMMVVHTIQQSPDECLQAGGMFTVQSQPLKDMSNNERDAPDVIDISLTGSNKTKSCQPSLGQWAKVCKEPHASRINPWDSKVVNKILSSLVPPLEKYKGFHSSNQKHKAAALLSSRSASHNKVLELGSRRYHLKGCMGQGAFAQVFKASEEQNRDKIVVLKIQRPPCPWEYYIYVQLDKRIPQEERASFGRAWRMHSYEDCSVMICAYGERGTLQDVVNSYLATGQKMDELLCMYYTVEMLRLLDALHSVRIIHGDFKPDNLLIRNEGELVEDWAPHRPGQWKHQGLCLIDWGRSIDMDLFPANTMFDADCNTSGFHCIEMQQQRLWTYQVDTYGLCCIVHVMLHGSYMEIETVTDHEQRQINRPKIPLKRYHNQEIWGQLFHTLLNVESCNENPSLGCLRTMLEKHLVSTAQFPKKLKDLMVRQSKIMCSRG